MKSKSISPAKLIALSFFLIILAGGILLTLPISANDGVQVSFIDGLFTSASAVCVTGLIAVDTADTFNVFGRTVVALLIQIGGLGVTSCGVGIVLIAGKHIGFKYRRLVREAWNIDTFGGLIKLVWAVLVMTLCFEFTGAVFSFLVFSKDFPPLDALGISVFHSIAAFNNSGFDILGGLQNLIPYQDNLLLNLTTSLLIIFGGLGFLVILDIIKCRSFQKLCLHSKVVISVSVFLLATGTLLLKWTEDITWLGAFFQSVSARTAGFSTFPIGSFTDAGLMVLTVLMFIGASPGSTGGGIKTSTLFVMLQYVKSTATGENCQAFRRKIPEEAIKKAFVIFLLALSAVLLGTFFLCVLEPEYTYLQNMFEITSAFGTVGLSTGITPDLSAASKSLLIAMMYIGRLGPLTVASLWFTAKRTNLSYSEEMITIG